MFFLSKYFLSPKIWIGMYLFALRDGIYMILTQDRQSYDNGELICLVALGPFAAFIFAFIFGNTNLIVQRALALETRHHEHMSFIRSAMDSLGLPKELQFRITSYHHYLRLHHNPSAYDSLFKGLSVNLLVELKLFLFRQLFISATFFKDCSSSLIQQIVLTLQECTYSPGDIIILRGQIGREVFFIVKGKCEVLNEFGLPFVTLKHGDYFGEIAMLYEQRRGATVRASTYCVLGRLDKTAFDRYFFSKK